MPLVYIWGFLYCMHTTMSNQIYKKDWTTFLKCKECWKFKELVKENRYKHPQWFMGVLWRCKECIKAWRKTERERIMSRKNDQKRYYEENGKRQKRLKEYAKDYYSRDYVKENKKKYMTERRHKMWYWKIHSKTEKFIRKKWIRPDKCNICWRNKKIIAHHPDYSKRNEVVFCCDSCHSKIHSWKIIEYNITDILII